MSEKEVRPVVKCSGHDKAKCGKCLHGFEHRDNFPETKYSCAANTHPCISGKRGNISCQCIPVTYKNIFE